MKRTREFKEVVFCQNYSHGELCTSRSNCVKGLHLSKKVDKWQNFSVFPVTRSRESPHLMLLNM